MAISVRGTASGNKTTTSTSATNLALTLSAAPQAGDVVFLAITDNQGGAAVTHLTLAPVVSSSPSNLLMSQLDYTGLISRYTITYVVPIVSGNTPTTTLTINYQPSTATSTTLAAVAVIVTGLASVSSYGNTWNGLRSVYGYGIIEGSSYGNGALGTSSVQDGTGGVPAGEIWLSQSFGGGGTSSPILTEYDSPTPFVAVATVASYGVSNSLRTLSGAVTVDTSGNVTTSGQSTGTVVYTPTGLSTNGSAAVVHAPTGNIIVKFTGTGTGTLTGCTVTNAPSVSYTIPSGTSIIGNGVALLASSSSTSSVTGGWYTGTGSSAGVVQISTTGSGTTPSNLYIMVGTAASSALSTPAYVSIRGAGPATGTGYACLYTFVPTTRTQSKTSRAAAVLTEKASKTVNRVKTAVATLSLSSRVSKVVGHARNALAVVLAPSQASKTASYLRRATATMSRSARSLKIVAWYVISAALAVLADYDIKTVNRVKTAVATLSRASRASKVVGHARNALAVVLAPSQVIKAATFRRSAKASATNVAVVSKAVVRNRVVVGTAVYAISSSKSRTFVRRVIATAIANAKATAVYQRYVSHPGTVSSDVLAPSVRGSVKVATVSADVLVPSVRGKTLTASVSATTETASVKTKAEPLV